MMIVVMFLIKNDVRIIARVSVQVIKGFSKKSGWGDRLGMFYKTSGSSKQTKVVGLKEDHS